MRNSSRQFPVQKKMNNSTHLIQDLKTKKLVLKTFLWLIPSLLILNIAFGVVQWHNLYQFGKLCSQHGSSAPLYKRSNTTTSNTTPILLSEKATQKCEYLYHLNQLRNHYSHFVNIPQSLQNNTKIFYTALKHHLGENATSWRPSKKFSTVESLFWSATHMNTSLLQEAPLLEVVKELNPTRVQDFVAAHSCDICKLPSEFLCNSTIAQMALQKCSSVYHCLCSTLKQDSSLLLPIVKKNESLMKVLHKSLLQSEKFLAELIEFNGHFVKYASEKFRNSFINMLPLIRKDGHVLQFASSRLKNNSPMVLEAVRQSATALQYAPKELRCNYEFMQKAILLNVWSVAWICPEMEESKILVAEAIRMHPMVLGVVDKSFKQDPVLVKFAAMKNSQALVYADDSLLNNKMFAMDLISKGCANCWTHFPANIKNDAEVLQFNSNSLCINNVVNSSYSMF